MRDLGARTAGVPNLRAMKDAALGGALQGALIGLAYGVLMYFVRRRKKKR